MNLICLDSQYFSWAIRQRPTAGQEGMVDKAKAFFRLLDDVKATILVPTPVVTELLLGADVSERTEILRQLEERFYVREFDKISAVHAADVWNKKRKDGVIDQLRKNAVTILPPEGNGWMRSKIKVDIMILGTAIASNVSAFYTEDAGLASLADGFVPVRAMPEIATQPLLPAFQEPNTP